MNKHKPNKSIFSEKVSGSFSDHAIRRRLLFEALQHQAALIPLTISFLCVIYLLLVSHNVGGGLWALLLLIISGFTTVIGFVWRYNFRYKFEYAKQTQKFIEILEQAERYEVEKQRKFLDFGFSRVGTTEGQKILNELNSEYELLQTTLNSQNEEDPLSMVHIPILAREAFRRGMSVLSAALELIEAASLVRKERLNKEISKLEDEVETFKNDKYQIGRLQVNKDRLTFYKQQLAILDQADVRVNQLLLQAERCEATIHHTRIEVAAIRAGSSYSDINSVIQTLESTIHQAKGVQEELNKLGY